LRYSIGHAPDFHAIAEVLDCGGRNQVPVLETGQDFDFIAIERSHPDRDLPDGHGLGIHLPDGGVPFGTR